MAMDSEFKAPTGPWARGLAFKPGVGGLEAVRGSDAAAATVSEARDSLSLDTP